MDLDLSLSEAFGFDFEGEEADFSIRDFGLAGKHDGIENQRYLQPRIYESIGQKLLFEHACDMVSGLRLEPGMRMFALVSGNFIFGDVIETMVTELGMEIRRMTIQTLSMSQANVDSLRNVVDTCFELESLRLVLSDYFYSHEKAPGRLVPYIYERLDVDDVLDVAFASVHTKIATIETTDGLKVVMDGSTRVRRTPSTSSILCSRRWTRGRSRRTASSARARSRPSGRGLSSTSAGLRSAPSSERSATPLRPMRSASRPCRQAPARSCTPSMAWTTSTIARRVPWAVR